MKYYIAKRILTSVFTLLAIIFILFAMLHIMPGSPFNDEKLTDEQKTVLYEKYGLDKPLVVQFVRYINNMLHGDFGVSYNISKDMPISTLIANRLSLTVRIGLQAIVIGAFLGILLGMVSAVHHNTIWDTAGTAISVIGVSVPSYVFALTLSYCFGFKLGWFPMLYSSSHAASSTILPSIALSFFPLASLSRFTRTEMIETLDSEYIELVESKGIHGVQMLLTHALRNVLIPIITVLAPLLVGLMTGSLVVEKIFSIPGIGSLLVTAITSNDYNVVIAIAFIYSSLYIGIMLVVDILYGIIDPRIRISGGSHE